jgi:hypothetical protein
MPPRLDSVVFIHVYKIVYLCIAAGLSLSFKQRTNLILKSSTTANKMKKSKPLTGAQKRKQKRELQEREDREQKELVADIGRLKLGPTDLWKLITDYPDIFETHVLLSGYLNESDIKMFYGSCRASRSAVKRAKIKLQERFAVQELSSISTMELAWEGYPWGETRRWPDGKEGTMNQEVFCFRVAETNDLKLLRWVREEKECDWDYHTSGIAAHKGNLDMLKYCCENGCEVHEGTCALAAKYGHLDCLEYLRSKNCPWDERVCKEAHENNHIDILTYAVKIKAPGYERYEQVVHK